MKIAKKSKDLVLLRESSPIKEQGGQAVIAKDFFLGQTSLALLSLEWH